MKLNRLSREEYRVGSIIRKNIFTLISLPWALQACSTSAPFATVSNSPPQASRAIASISDLDQTLGQIADTHVLAARYLREFDELIKNPATRQEALESEVYARLMAIRMIRESAVANLEAFNQDPVKVIPSDKLQERIQARVETRGLRGTLGRLTSRTLSEGLGTPINPTEWTSLQKQLTPAITSQNWRAQLERPELLDQVNELARAWREDQSSRREPQSEVKLKKIEPGTGRTGNVVGWEYPENTWSLTFDDGPGTTSTDAVLSNLSAAGIKATFFQVTNMLLKNTDRASAVREAGMELANHSWTHANLPRVGQTQLQREIRDSTAEILRIHGVRPKLFRLPYGSGVNTPTIRSLMAGENLVHVFWNVDTLDWQDKNSASVARRAIGQITDQKKGVILFHDVHAHTPEAARLVIEHLKKLNTRFLTVGQAIEEINAHRE